MRRYRAKVDGKDRGGEGKIRIYFNRYEFNMIEWLYEKKKGRNDMRERERSKVERMDTER